jgi:hypothetical protein
MAKSKDSREGEARKTPEEVQAEVDAMVQPLADYLVEASDHNLPLAHRAGQMLRDAASLIVTVASSPEPPVELVPPPGEEIIPEAERAAQQKGQKMAPLYDKSA